MKALYKVCISGIALVSAVSFVSPTTGRSKNCNRTPEIYDEDELEELKKLLKADKLFGLKAKNISVEPVGEGKSLDSDDGSDGDDGSGEGGDAGGSAAKKTAKKKTAKKKTAKKKTAKKATTG